MVAILKYRPALFYFIFCLGFHISLGQSKVVQLANEDQIWSKTWVVINEKLVKWQNENSKKKIIDQISDKFDIPKNMVQLLLRYTLNYTSNEISVDKVIFRFPHYNENAIREDLNKLVTEKLIRRDANFEIYYVLQKGKIVISTFWELRDKVFYTLSKEVKEELKEVIKVLKKVTDSAINYNDSYPNKSIYWRRISWEYKLNVVSIPVLAQELYKDYNAYNNDNAHYRFDRLFNLTENEDWKNLKLNPLEKELIATMRNNRKYLSEKCISHQLWRIPPVECQNALNNLISLGLIQNSNDEYSQSENGKRLFDAAQKLTDERFYAPWKKLTIGEYKKYKKAINKLIELL